MGAGPAVYPDLAYRASAEGYSRASQWHPVDCPQWCALERSSGEIRSASDCVQLLLPLAGRWNLEKDLRALRGLEHWRGAEHGFNVDQSICAGRSWNKKASKTQTSSSIGKTRGGLNTKIHAIVGKDLRPVAFLLSAGNVDDCTEAVSLLKLLPALKDCDILADKAYGTKEIRTYLHDQSARYTIPPKVNTKQPWPFDKETYKRRNVIERFFNRLKKFRRAETRYDKRDDSFLAFVMVAAICVAFSILHI